VVRRRAEAVLEPVDGREPEAWLNDSMVEEGAGAFRDLEPWEGALTSGRFGGGEGGEELSVVAPAGTLRASNDLSEEIVAGEGRGMTLGGRGTKLASGVFFQEAYFWP
jgi:hypothetical protein